jgi:hypothetical protein
VFCILYRFIISNDLLKLLFQAPFALAVSQVSHTPPGLVNRQPGRVIAAVVQVAGQAGSPLNLLLLSKISLQLFTKMEPVYKEYIH